MRDGLENLDVASLQTTSSRWFSCKKIAEFLFNIRGYLLHKVQLTKSQHDSDNGLVPIRRQALSEPAMTPHGDGHMRQPASNEVYIR